MELDAFYFALICAITFGLFSVLVAIISRRLFLPPRVWTSRVLAALLLVVLVVVPPPLFLLTYSGVIKITNWGHAGVNFFSTHIFLGLISVVLAWRIASREKPPLPEKTESIP